MTIHIDISWAVIGKLCVSALIALFFGYIGAVCCMDDDSMPNQISRAVFWAIGIGLIAVVWWL